MLVEIDLLDYLAYQMGCGILSDLRLFQQSERLHRLTARDPFRCMQRTGMAGCGTVFDRP